MWEVFLSSGPGRAVALLWLIIFASSAVAAPPAALAQVRPARPADRAQPSAGQAYAAAESLMSEGTVEAARRAVEQFKRALALWRAAGERRAEVETLGRLGDALYFLRDTRGALGYYEGEALPLARALADPRIEADALNRVGLAYVFLGDNRKALDASRRALELSRDAGHLRGQARALNNIGEAQYAASEMQAALESFDSALALWRQLGDPKEEANTLVNAAYCHYDLSRPEHALDACERALGLARGAGAGAAEALALTALGNFHKRFGDTQEALNYYLQARRLVRLRGDPYEDARVSGSIGLVYEAMGEKHRALEFLNGTLDTYRQLGSRSGEALYLIYAGRCYQSLRLTRQAVENYSAALALGRSMPDPLVESMALKYLGRAYHASGDDAKALEHYRQALAVSPAGVAVREEALLLCDIGEAHEGTGDAVGARHNFQRALELYRSAKDRVGESLTLGHLARTDLRSGRTAEALARIKESLGIIETLRAKVASYELRASFFASVRGQYEFYVDLMMREHAARPGRGFDTAAFEASERSRARSLLDTLAEARVDIRQGADAGLLRRERELQRQLNARSERLIQLLGEKAAPEELARQDRELGGLTTEYEQVQSQIRASSPHYAALVQPAPLTLGEIQQKVLDADTLLLEYALGEERSFVWAVTPESIRSFELPPRAEIEKVSRRVYELLTARNLRARVETRPQWQARVGRAEAEYAEASAALGRMILGPVAAELGRKRLLVVADGALQYVPFAALPVPGGDAATPAPADFIPLIAEHEVVSLPSASVLGLTREEMRGRNGAPRAVAVLADPVFDRDDERLMLAKGARTGRRGDGRAKPDAEVSLAAADVWPRALRSFDGLDGGEGIARLPFSRREAEAIISSVPEGEGMLALGFRASRAVATSRELAQYRIVHFATHGLINSEHPELSGVILSLFDEAGRRQDGFLELHEIYNLNLPAELVVLSACQTALGKDVKGEGLVGLTRGFMYAGARRVVASLWKVDDSATAELMKEFYGAMLGKGLRPAEALRAAQLHMSRQPRWRSPYFWAAFTLQGEWR